MRTHGIPASSGEPVCLFRTDKALKRHPAYGLAKSGDPAAAVKLVHDLASPLVELASRFGSRVTFVAPHALEASGENAIPQTLAVYLAQRIGARDDVNIVQRNKVYHTGADAMQRLIARSEFTGAVDIGVRYVLVDDVSTMGGTLADLASHILTNGAQVCGSVLLVNAARSGKVIPSPKTLKMLQRRFGNEIQATFGIKTAALTWEEAQYLIGFRSVDELRNRAATAQQARIKRLRSKGIHLNEVSGDVAPEQSHDDA
jgi:hypothetical protein